MTALNVIVQRDAAHLLCDAAMTDVATGAVINIEPKAWVFPRLKAAFAVSGPALREGLGGFLNSRPATTIADLKRLVVDTAWHLTAAADRAWPLRRGTPANGVRVAAIAWNSAEKRPEAWSVGTYGQSGHEGADGVLYTGGRGWLQPGFDGVEGFLSRWDDLDPIEDGRAILEAQRHTMGERGWPTVGGFGERVTVTRKGLTWCNVIEWPDDVLGQPIRPGAGAVSNPPSPKTGPGPD